MKKRLLWSVALLFLILLAGCDAKQQADNSQPPAPSISIGGATLDTPDVSDPVHLPEKTPEVDQSSQLLPDRSTLPMSELSIQALEQLGGSQISYSENDEEKIEAMVCLLLAIKCDQFASCDYADFDFSLLWAKDPRSIDNLNYFQRTVEAEKWTHYVTETIPLWCDSELSDLTITCEGDTATVSVYQWLSYQYPSVDYTSGYGIPYEIILVKDGGQWKISDISFYNEALEILRDPSYTVEELLSDRWCEVH